MISRYESHSVIPMMSKDDSCDTDGCRTASCSPCRFIWTVMAVDLAILLLMETFL